MSNQINTSNLYVSNTNPIGSTVKYICLMKCSRSETNQSCTIALSGYSDYGSAPSSSIITFSPRGYLITNAFAKVIGGTSPLLGYKQIGDSYGELWIKITAATKIIMRPICYMPSGVTFFPNGSSLLATEPSGIVWNKAEVS